MNLFYIPINMDLHLLCQIASQSSEVYYALLAIPQFARHVRAGYFIYPRHFARKEADEKNNIIHYFNNKKYFILYNDGAKEWFHNDLLHRDNDAPATILNNNDFTCWYYHGCRHREYPLPAISGEWTKDIWYYRGTPYFCNRRDTP